jgi:hypothetical protein
MNHKSIILVLVFFLSILQRAFSQTNTFPSSGNVGIGTTSPSKKLEISTSEATQLRLGYGTASSSYTYDIGRDNVSGYLKFTANEGTNAYGFIFNNGKVGIGTSTPGQSLGLIGNILLQSGDGKIGFTNDIVNFYLGYQDNTHGIVGHSYYGWEFNGDTGIGLRVKGDGNVGIGTSTPSDKLDVNGNIGIGYTGWQTGQFASSYSSPDEGITYTAKGHTGGWYGVHDFFTTYNGGSPVFAMRIKNGNVGIGTTSPQNKLDVNGTIRAKEIIATLDGWSDYVFDDFYKLLPLGELEKYITAKNKLPEVPSEKEVIKDGVSLGEMNSLLLKKIEELTLYLIELNKKSDTQSSEIELLRHEIRLLKSSRE